MGTFFELLANATQVFILTWFLTKAFGFKNNNNISRIGFIIMWITVFVEISFINHIVVYDGFLSGIIILTCFLYCRLYLKGSYQAHAFVSLFAIAIIFTVSSVTIFFISYLTGQTMVSLLSDFTYSRLIILSVCRVFEILVYKFIININTEYALTKKEWALFTTMPLLTWIVVTLITEITLQIHSTIPKMFYVALIMVIINIIIYFFMYKIKQDTKTKLEYEMLKMHHDNINKMELNMKAIYENTYSLKHDLEKHLLAIKTMAKNNQCTEIELYIDGIIDDNLNAVQKIIFTDNDIFNAIVNTKLELCRSKNIFPSVNVSNDAVSCIKPSCIAVLFGNIFDNAIEAAEKTKEKIIIFNVQLQGEYVSIYMENSFDNRYSSLKLNTTKDEKSEHGFGTKNVRKIVEDNDGMIQYFQNEFGMFCCDILLKRC